MIKLWIQHVLEDEDSKLGTLAENTDNVNVRWFRWLGKLDKQTSEKQCAKLLQYTCNTLTSFIQVNPDP